MSFLKNHPFGIDAKFESSIVLTYAFPKEELKKFIPQCLELDTFEDTWAFVAIAMVSTKRLRPKGFPVFLGMDFFLVGYRIFTIYRNKANKRLRGLYILKSETDKWEMEILGNLFTHYNYSKTDIGFEYFENCRNISSLNSDFNVTISNQADAIDLPTGSPFKTWDEARRFAGPLPFTFTCFEKEKSVLIVEGVRQNWKPKPLRIEHHYFDFFDKLGLSSPLLANAFEVNNVPYSWKKGVVERW